ncbi:hypothetical protein [Bacillus haynesii]|uniref:hypothetical protein n=1 Tax=Bacillus haynesii TaxID=1925021 RepID=UPI0035DDA7C1
MVINVVAAVLLLYVYLPEMLGFQWNQSFASRLRNRVNKDTYFNPLNLGVFTIMAFGVSIMWTLSAYLIENRIVLVTGALATMALLQQGFEFKRRIEKSISGKLSKPEFPSKLSSLAAFVIIINTVVCAWIQIITYINMAP